MAKKERPTQARLKEVFSYDPTTGIFIRKVPAKFNPPTRKYGRIGDGRVTELGYVLLMLDGTNHIAGPLAWLYVHGEYPDRVKYINGNPLDNRLENIRVHSKSRQEIKNAALTVQRLKELIDYNPDTGLVIWKINTATTKPGMRAGSSHGLGYRQIGIDYKKYLEHSIVWLFMTSEWPDHEVDHINGVKHDNRWSNLRMATRSQNSHNKPNGRGGATGFPGVVKSGNSFRSRIDLDGDCHDYGRHPTIAEARIARLLGEKKLFGRFTTWLTERDSRLPSGDSFVSVEIRDNELYVDGKLAWSEPQVTEMAA